MTFHVFIQEKCHINIYVYCENSKQKMMKYHKKFLPNLLTGQLFSIFVKKNTFVNTKCTPSLPQWLRPNIAYKKILLGKVPDQQKMRKV